MATKILILLNILAFLAQLYTGATTLQGGSSDAFALLRLGALFTPLMQDFSEWWRIIAAQFLHIGIIHILFNMMGLRSLGPAVEQLFGSFGFLVLYLACGIGGMGLVSILYLIGFTSKPVLVVGASAGVLGLVGLIAGLVARWYQMFKTVGALHQLKRLTEILLLQAILDFVVPQVSSTAHIGGALTGFMLGYILAPRFSKHRIPEQAHYDDTDYTASRRS